MIYSYSDIFNILDPIKLHHSVRIEFPEGFIFIICCTKKRNFNIQYLIDIYYPDGSNSHGLYFQFEAIREIQKLLTLPP